MPRGEPRPCGNRTTRPGHRCRTYWSIRHRVRPSEWCTNASPGHERATARIRTEVPRGSRHSPRSRRWDRATGNLRYDPWKVGRCCDRRHRQPQKYEPSASVLRLRWKACLCGYHATGIVVSTLPDITSSRAHDHGEPKCTPRRLQTDCAADRGRRNQHSTLDHSSRGI